METSLPCRPEVKRQVSEELFYMEAGDFIVSWVSSFLVMEKKVWRILGAVLKNVRKQCSCSSEGANIFVTLNPRRFIIS